MTPQVYGRWLEAAMIDHYGWGGQPGSGNQWNRPSDALGPNDYQIEIKAHQWTPGQDSSAFSFPLLGYWTKLVKEAQRTGRTPILIAAVKVSWAVGFVDGNDTLEWDLPALTRRELPSGKRVQEHPETWLVPMQYHAPQQVWVRLPLNQIPGLVDRG